MNYCPKCGRKIEDQEVGCPVCGIRNEAEYWEQEKAAKQPAQKNTEAQPSHDPFDAPKAEAQPAYDPFGAPKAQAQPAYDPFDAPKAESFRDPFGEQKETKRDTVHSAEHTEEKQEKADPDLFEVREHWEDSQNGKASQGKVYGSEELPLILKIIIIALVIFLGGIAAIAGVIAGLSLKKKQSEDYRKFGNVLFWVSVAVLAVSFILPMLTGMLFFYY